MRLHWRQFHAMRTLNPVPSMALPGRRRPLPLSLPILWGVRLRRDERHAESDVRASAVFVQPSPHGGPAEARRVAPASSPEDAPREGPVDGFKEFNRLPGSCKVIIQFHVHPGKSEDNLSLLLNSKCSCKHDEALPMC